MEQQKNWIGVDLDGTLALHNRPDWEHNIDEPIKLMVDRVKDWLSVGADVRIVSARACDHNNLINGVPVFDEYQVKLIQDWTEKYIGVRLPVQFWKDYYMDALWDDRAVSVIRNSGEVKEYTQDYLDEQINSAFDEGAQIE